MKKNILIYSGVITVILITSIVFAMSHKSERLSSAMSVATTTENTEATSSIISADLASTTASATISIPKPSQGTPQPTPTPTPTPAPKTGGYSSSEVSLHNNESSCWTIINNKVYNLTSFISEHPGGEHNILKICGKDGTSAFENQHEGDRRPNALLAGFYIGEVN